MWTKKDVMGGEGGDRLYLHGIGEIVVMGYGFLSFVCRS
jgi:hypothetical protein